MSFVTAAGEMTTLAAPSLGSTELAAWRVRMAPGAAGPVHVVDREQVWLPTSGSFTATVADRTGVFGPGDVLVVPAGAVRQVGVREGPAEALVCMAAGGTASLPGTPGTVPIPWAE